MVAEHCETAQRGRNRGKPPAEIAQVLRPNADKVSTQQQQVGVHALELADGRVDQAIGRVGTGVKV